MSKTTRLPVRPLFWLVGIAAAALSIATPCIADSAQPESASGATASQAAAPDAESARESDFLRRVARVRADVVRRVGGEWMIVALGLGSPDALPASPSEKSDPMAAQPGLRAMLQEYERAFEEQDSQRLAAVWLMNPLQRKEIERLFAEMSSVSVSVRSPVLLLDTRDRGHLEFDQHFRVAAMAPPAYSARGALNRALAAHDAYGDWSVEKVLEAR